MNIARIKKLSWLFLAIVLLLSVMPFQIAGASGWDEELFAPDEAVIEAVPDLSVWLIDVTSELASSDVQSLHVPVLPFHPPT